MTKAELHSETMGNSVIGHGAHGAADLRGFELQIRVYYQDTDAGGIVYHTRYLDFMERARTEWLRDLGIDLPDMAATHRRMFVAKSVTIDYRRPARLDELVTVRTRAGRLGHTYIDLNQDIFRGSMQLTQGEVRIVCVDTMSLKPCALPREVTTRIHKTGPSA